MKGKLLIYFNNRKYVLFALISLCASILSAKLEEKHPTLYFNPHYLVLKSVNCRDTFYIFITGYNVVVRCIK